MTVANVADEPLVSIVTPSYNQAPFLEQTILSVLNQDYPTIEYIIIDGGSTDGSVDIIKKYEDRLAYWVSEPDRGQSDAINKGFARATGNVFGWLNSDDMYEEGAIARVAEHFIAYTECQLVYGEGRYVDEAGTYLYPASYVQPFDRKRLLSFDYVLQPAAFWRRSLWERTGKLRLEYNWGMDWEWFLRAAYLTNFCHISQSLALYRIVSSAKTVTGGQKRQREIAAIARRHGGALQPTHVMYHVDTMHERITQMTACMPRPVKRPLRAPTWLLRQVAESIYAGRFMR